MKSAPIPGILIPERSFPPFPPSIRKRGKNAFCSMAMCRPRWPRRKAVPFTPAALMRMNAAAESVVRIWQTTPAITPSGVFTRWIVDRTLSREMEEIKLQQR